MNRANWHKLGTQTLEEYVRYFNKIKDPQTLTVNEFHKLRDAVSALKTAHMMLKEVPVDEILSAR